MGQFLVEAYVPGGDRETAHRGGLDALRAAEQVSREGARVRYLQCLLVPEDETCFYLYEASAPAAVAAAAQRAGLTFDRVAEAVTVPTGPA